MFEFSESLAGSKIGYKTFHNVLMDGKQIGRVEVGYLTKEDVKIFKRSKRKLKVGQPFGVQVFIETSKGVRAKDLGLEKLLEIVEALKKDFKDLDERDVYFIELENDHRNIIGRVIDL